MNGRAGLERFRKAQTLEPFSVTSKSSHKQTTEPLVSSIHPQSSHQETPYKNQLHDPQKTVGPEVTAPAVPGPQVTQVGGGQSTWQPPDWAIEPRPGVYYLEVLKDGEVLGQINLDKRRHIFGRQFPMCDFVLDHQSISRQHAAVVPHMNGSVFVIDLGSVHGTFVANERLTKYNPVELEPGQSLVFAASTRTYILRKNIKALFPPPLNPAEINLPPPPDPSNEEAVLAYNTALNRYGLAKSSKNLESSFDRSDDRQGSSRPAKKTRKLRVTFRDQVGGELSEVIGVSDGADVENETGPVGVKEGSFVGKYESLVEIIVIPKGKEQVLSRENSITQKGVTDRLQEVLNKVKSTPKSNAIYDDLYGESFLGKVGSSWAYASVAPGDGQGASTKYGAFSRDSTGRSGTGHDDNDYDLFGD